MKTYLTVKGTTAPEPGTMYAASARIFLAFASPSAIAISEKKEL